MNAWVYKVNSRGAAEPGRAPGWHFNRYFRWKGSGVYEMGGREWIRSPQSWARLRRARKGDLFVCYQTDERKIYGLARAAGDGYESLKGSGIFDSIDLRGGGLKLGTPVPVANSETRRVFRQIAAFTVPSRGTVHALRRDELAAILRLLGQWNPSQRHALERFAGSRQ